MGKKKRDVDFNWLFDLPKKMVEEFYPDHILADFTLIRHSSVFVVECHLKVIFFMLGFRNWCKNGV